MLVVEYICVADGKNVFACLCLSFSGKMAQTLLVLVFTLIISQCEVNSKFPDWLVTRITTPTKFRKTSAGTMVLSNGLISREFGLDPNFYTVDYYSHEKQSSLLRAIGPEAQVIRYAVITITYACIHHTSGSCYYHML